MIDTHSHIYGEEFNDDRAQVVERALNAGVEHIIMPNIDLASISPMIDLHHRYPDCTSITMGLHPTEVGADYQQHLEDVYQALTNNPCVAVGEIGIDLYWDKTFRNEQIEALHTQLLWAEQLDLPVILHVRDGLDEVLHVMDNYRGSSLPNAVFHCFGGSADDVEKIRRRGDFYFGIGGIVTFKKSTLPDVLHTIGIDRILLETDAPYLAPVPFRGKRNEPAYIPLICDKIALSLGISPDDVSRITDANARTLFNRI